MSRAYVFALLTLIAANSAIAESPKCDDYVGYRALELLQGEKLLKKDVVDTSLTSVERIASEQVSPNLHRQVYLVTYWLKESKGFVRAIAVNRASDGECSDLLLYRVSDDLRE